MGCRGEAMGRGGSSDDGMTQEATAAAQRGGAATEARHRKHWRRFGEGELGAGWLGTGERWRRRGTTRGAVAEARRTEELLPPLGVMGLADPASRLTVLVSSSDEDAHRRRIR